jgi:hypothetical protein
MSRHSMLSLALLAGLLPMACAQQFAGTQEVFTRTSQPEHTTFTDETPLPLPPGTLEGCEYYRDYDPDYPEQNLCKRVARSVDVSTAHLLEWNPSLSSNMSTCALQPGYRYCALKDESYGRLHKDHFPLKLPCFERSSHFGGVQK